MASSLSAIVLAGGASTRLGLDKANLRFGGRPLLHIIVDRLSAICDEVLVACGQRRITDTPDTRVRFVYDSITGQGPLAGMQAGLTAASSDCALLVGCDMPFLNRDLISHMAGLPRDYQALVPRVGDRWHPLHAIYARSCLPAVESLLAQGGNSMTELLDRLNVRVLSEAELHRYDPEGWSLFNLNGPGDLSRARAHWRTLETATSTGSNAAPGR